MRDTVIDTLFSLLTSPDRAQAIAGDLAEERERQGSAWFWRQVAGVTWALWRGAVTDAPLRVLALTMAGGAFLTAPAFGGLAAVRLFPQLIGSPMNWIALFVWWGGAFLTGAFLVLIAPRRGMAACANLAVFGAALLITLGVTLESRQLANSVIPMFFTIGLGIAVALLAGGAVARRRVIGAVTMLLLLTVASSASAQRTESLGPSPHAVKMVTVDHLDAPVSQAQSESVLLHIVEQNRQILA